MSYSFVEDMPMEAGLEFSPVVSLDLLDQKRQSFDHVVNELDGDAFLAASRGGDLDALVMVLDPDVVLRADRAAVHAGASKEVRGAAAVAGTFSGRSRFAQPALVNGAVGAVWAPGGRPRVVFGFTIKGRRIVEIELVADPERLGQLDLAVLDAVRSS
jgi:hypothetical protein